MIEEKYFTTSFKVFYNKFKMSNEQKISHNNL